MSVAVWSGSLVAWERELAALKERIGPVFGRAETRATAGAFLDGLLSGVARKTGWLLAEQAGLDQPYRMQSLLGRSRWEADGLRDRVRADVIEALGDADGVLVVDETGFLKKGVYRPQLVRHLIACYAASAADESWFCRMAAGVWNPCRSMSQLVL